MASMALQSTAARTAAAGATADVPIFLQKAYHMIDTCDPKICSWSEDGLTFIVKNTSLFEMTIIPQFFKHNKFSSFVRQLNFYGFRKVKFSNSLKIDHRLEAETAKFWRFRHDKFRKGRKDLLKDIKRTPSAATTTSGVNKAIVPRAVLSSNVQPLVPKPPEEVTHLKTEMEAMKQRIASMTRNIDELTDLVKKVSVNGNEGEGAPPAAKLVEPEVVGNKRKKIESVQIKEEDSLMDNLSAMPDWNPSSSDLAGVTSLSVGHPPLPELTTSGAARLEKTPSPAPSDDSFVDDLFQAFADEDAIIPGMESLAKEPEPKKNPSTPCPRLMKRIEDSLSRIPRDMHELVATRLIDAIADTCPIVQEASSLFPTEGCAPDDVTKLDESSCVEEDELMDDAVVPQAVLSNDDQTATEGATSSSSATPTSIPLPLAVATLKTILAEYGVSVECRRESPCKNAASAGFAKSLPVVPMHV